MQEWVKMNNKESKEENEPCNSNLVKVVKIFFLIQGLVVAAAGIGGIVTYNRYADIERIKLNRLSCLIAIHACIHLAVAVFCLSRVCANYRNKISIQLALLFIVPWSCWLTWILVFGDYQVYKYEQELTFPVSMFIALTSVYELLVIGTIFLLYMKIYTGKELINTENVNKSPQKYSKLIILTKPLVDRHTFV